MSKADSEVLYRLHYDRHSLEVGEWPEGPDYIELRTVGEKNQQYWGTINLSMHADMALKVGQALIKMAEAKGATK